MTDSTITAKLATCQHEGCAKVATHRSGYANARQLNLCVEHTNERETQGAWSRSL